MTETKKLYHSISEVSEALGVKPHVLRYWETQFRSLRPKKNRAGNRSYQDKDLALLEQIRELLYDRKFTIAGARKELERRRREAEAAGSEGPTGSALSPAERSSVEAAVVGAEAPGPDAAVVDPIRSPPGGPPGPARANPEAGRGAGALGAPARRTLREVRKELSDLKGWLEAQP